MIPHPLIDDYLKLKQPFDTSSNIPKDATVYGQKMSVYSLASVMKSQA